MAIKVQPLMPSTRIDACYDATLIASQLQLPVCFDWNNILTDFVVYPHDTFRTPRERSSAYVRMTKLMKDLGHDVR